MSPISFAAGVVWSLITICVGLWMGVAVVSGLLKDCDKLGHFRFGEKVVECKVVRP
jgi:hypothetical protein